MSPVVSRLERTTVFFGSEGDCEEVFLSHLKKTYSRGRAEVKVKSAGGKSPEYIVEKSIVQRGSADYSHSAILMDTDKPMTAAVRMAESNGFEVFGSTPCLEGLLLSLLGDLPVPTTSRACKKKFQSKYNGGKNVLTEEACERHFTKEVLEHARARIDYPLNKIISRFEGKLP